MNDNDVNDTTDTDTDTGTPTDTNDGRLDASDALVAALVVDKVAELVKAGESFTAFDVTKALRSANPTIELDHDRVRSAVRAAVAATPTYEVTQTIFPGGTALLFQPSEDEDEGDDDGDGSDGGIIILTDPAIVAAGASKLTGINLLD